VAPGEVVPRGMVETAGGWQLAAREHLTQRASATAVVAVWSPRMEPSEAINVVESVLRQAIREVLGDAWSDGTGVDVTILEQRRLEEAKRRNGAVVDEHLLAYTHLRDLQQIVLRRWASFKPIFKDQSRFKVYMGRLEDFRNAPMHSRSLLPFERSLISGIAGEFRNVLTLWRSQRAPDMTWYPRIESITDSLGNAVAPDGPVGNVVVPARLQVGELLTFRCIGWDPDDREPTWTLHAQAAHGPELDRQVGAAVTLSWHVQDAQVAESSIIVIQMRSPSQYHRLPWGVDASVSAFYAVSPPL
jgi:hypothetical protein